MNKKGMVFLLIIVFSFSLISCNAAKEAQKIIEPRASQMIAISELAAMECYYHNVAKFFEEDASGVLLWKKDKKFWVEYSGIVKVGIDTSQLNVSVKDNIVTITLPRATVLDKKVDDTSLTIESFIVDEESAKVTGEDEIKAFAEAQDMMVEAAANDTALLASAQQRVQKLLEEYVKNIGDAIGKEYFIEWKYINSDIDEI